MRINLKTVANKTFTVDAEPTDSIAQIKTKVEQQGEYSATGMKIIFGGKILDDNVTIGEAGIDETHKNIVVVAKKLSAVPPKKKEETSAPPTTTTTTTATTSTPTTSEPPKQETVATPSSQSTTTSTPTTQQPQQTVTQPPAFTPDPQLVTQFLEMGFEQPNIDECLRAAQNDAQRAAEFLMTGIPDFVRMAMNAPQQQQLPQQQQTQQQLPQQTGSDLSGIAAMLQQFPQFNQLRAAIQSNPHLLTPIMQRLAQSNPELVTAINQNPEEFIRLLNEPVQMPPQQQQQQGAFGGFGGMGGFGGGMPQQQQQQGFMRPPPGTVMVTPQEKEAIDRLVGMGFDRVLAVQAFFACGKDENLAANFLLENPELLEMGDDDDDMNTGGDPAHDDQNDQ